MVEVQLLAIADDWHNKASWGWYSRADIDEIPVDHFIIVNHCVNDWLFFKGLDRCFHEGAHESQLDTVLLGELLLDLSSCLHEVAHIDLVESGQ